MEERWEVRIQTRDGREEEGGDTDEGWQRGGEVRNFNLPIQSTIKLFDSL